MPFHVYILRCRDGSLYIGHTYDLDQRVAEHNAGKAALFTRNRRPVTVDLDSLDVMMQDVAVELQSAVAMLEEAPALIEAVQDVVDDNRPITADALVFSPEVVTVPVTLGVTPRAGYDTAAMDTEIRRRLSVFFGDIEDGRAVGNTCLTGIVEKWSRFLVTTQGLPAQLSP